MYVLEVVPLRGETNFTGTQGQQQIDLFFFLGLPARQGKDKGLKF